MDYLLRKTIALEIEHSITIFNVKDKNMAAAPAAAAGAAAVAAAGAAHNFITTFELEQTRVRSSLEFSTVDGVSHLLMVRNFEADRAAASINGWAGGAGMAAAAGYSGTTIQVEPDHFSITRDYANAEVSVEVRIDPNGVPITMRAFAKGYGKGLRVALAPAAIPAPAPAPPLVLAAGPPPLVLAAGPPPAVPAAARGKAKAKPRAKAKAKPRAKAAVRRRP